MTNHTGTFTMQSWDESPAYGPEAPLPRIATVETTNSYEGALEGTGAARLILSYGPDGTGVYRGYEQVEGVLDGRAGAFVLEHHGEFDAAGVRTTWTIMPGTGRDGLEGVRGTGEFAIGQDQPSAAYRLDWEAEG